MRVSTIHRPFVPILAATFLLAACSTTEVAPTFVAPVSEPANIPQLPPIAVERPIESGSSRASEAELALGKYLFFDRALSGDQKLNCATCHVPDQAWTDGLPLSIGYPGSLYFRNTPTLLNTGSKEKFFWDGRLADLPTVVRDHIAEAHFMHADGRLVVERLRQKPEYVELFDRVYGREPTYGAVLNAIAAYVGSLESQNSPYDQFLAGGDAALSPIAQDGLALFETNCASCHSGSLLSDGQHHGLGVPENPDVFADPLRHITFRRFFRTLGITDYSTLSSDLGLYALTRQDEDLRQFLTPSLREVGRTAPYMHNGVFETLDEVVAFYSAGGTAGSELSPMNLTPSEQAALVEFLESLSGDAMPIVVPETPSYQLTDLGGGG